MKQKHWYHYLWIWSILYFSLGFVNILFAWLGLISFWLPLLLLAVISCFAIVIVIGASC